MVVNTGKEMAKPEKAFELSLMADLSAHWYDKAEREAKDRLRLDGSIRPTWVLTIPSQQVLTAMHLKAIGYHFYIDLSLDYESDEWSLMVQNSKYEDNEWQHESVEIWSEGA